MGVNNLLITFQNKKNNIHISKYTNKTVGIDGFCWYFILLNIGFINHCIFLNRLNLLENMKKTWLPLKIQIISSIISSKELKY